MPKNVTKKLYTLTDEHRAQLKPWAERWIANALNVAPYDGDDLARARGAMDDLYRAAGLEPPRIGIVISSPLVGAIATPIASAGRWLRAEPEEVRKLFGRVPTEDDLATSIGRACRFAVRAAFGLPVEALRRQSVAATAAATAAATEAATEAATDAATYAATAAATDAATDAATRAATAAATEAATAAATRAATDAATEAATFAATRAATREATFAATRAATDAATYAATHAATAAATHAATDAATEAATHAATDAATRAATRAATEAATDAATRAATYAATRAATEAATDLDPIVAFLVRCCAHWFRFYNGGQQWSAWVSYLSFFRHVARLDLPEYERFAHYEAMTTFGPRFMHRDFWMLCERPAEIHRDEQNRPHRAGGPAVRWRDGWSCWYHHGVRVTEDVIMDRFSAADVLAESNLEVRRCMMEIRGTARFLDELGSEVIHEDTDSVVEVRRLHRATLPGEREPLVAVEVLNSTPNREGGRRRYVLRVPPDVKTCHEAVMRSFRLDPKMYRVRQET